MKKYGIAICIIIGLIAVMLYIATKTSHAHLVARDGIVKSPEILRNIGSANHIFLTMFSQKTGPTGKGCTTLTYFVVGTAENEWVQVRLLSEGHKSDWTVVEIIEGFSARHQVECTYG